jgi:regulator of replication initiation timing
MIEVTENLLYKLEEKMMALLTDAEGLRQQVQRLQQENAVLKQDKDNHTRKLQDLVSLLDSVSATDQAAPFASAYGTKPSLVQEPILAQA